MPAQVCYVYFTFYLLKFDGYGKPTLLEHYPTPENIKNFQTRWAETKLARPKKWLRK